jgi:hypothetical protein
LAKLAFALRKSGVACRLYDANIDCLLGLMAQDQAAEDTWSRRALAHRQANLNGLRSRELYTNRDRYKRAVNDIARVLRLAGRSFDAAITPSNYSHASLSPVRSRDLIQAAENYASNPFYSIFSPALKCLFSQQEPAVIGLSIGFMSQALCAFAMIGFIRHLLPRARIVCGGGLITSWLNIPGFDNPFAGYVDALICGPGEQRLIGMCKEKTEGATSITGYDYSNLDMDRYLSPVRVLPYSASRGCYWKKCAFCPEKAENEPYLSADPQDIFDDLADTTEKTSAGLIHFLDNALSPRFLQYLAEHPPGIPWYGFARITRHLTDSDFVMNLKDAGCSMLKLGVESGDPKVLDELGKGIDPAAVSKALDTVHRAGIATYVYLLFGTPAENEQSALKTLAFTRDHTACIDFLNLAVFNLPAYGEEAKGLDTVDFYDGDLSLYREFNHPLNWNRKQVRHFLSRTFIKTAGIRDIVNNDPPYFTSNHAPFFSRT